MLGRGLYRASMGLLEGKVALVTGAAGGLGREIALSFVREGASLVVADLGVAKDGSSPSGDPVRSIAAEITAMGGVAVPVWGSVAAAADVEAMVQTAVGQLGRLDVVTHLAGFVVEKTLVKTDDLLFDDTIATILRGTFLVVREAGRAMAKLGSPGSIVVCSSAAAFYGQVAQAHYAAANAGVVALARTAAIELKKQGTRVNVLVPLARTRMTEELPMFRTVTEATMGPAFVAPVALFLASDLSRDVTGEVVGAAGGRVYAFKTREANGAFRERPWSPEEIRDAWSSVTKV